MNPAVYKNIKKIRELKNLTRDHVADELKMSTSGYGKIERGEVDLTVSKLQKIADVLDVSIEFIFRFDVSIFFETKAIEEKTFLKRNIFKLSSLI